MNVLLPIALFKIIVTSNTRLQNSLKNGIKYIQMNKFLKNILKNKIDKIISAIENAIDFRKLAILLFVINYYY